MVATCCGEKIDDNDGDSIVEFQAPNAMSYAIVIVQVVDLRSRPIGVFGLWVAGNEKERGG